MTQSAAFSNLSATLTLFNNKLDTPNKLDDKALRTIQNYLNDPQVTTLEPEDEEKMQCSLRELEKLREQATLARTSSTVMKKINRQLKNLEKLLIENFEETKGDAYFITVKLEVCFLDILSENTNNSSKHWQKIYEEKMTSSAAPETSRETPHPHAPYMDKQQRLISELMNAALINVMDYLEDRKKLFSEHFTQNFLDSLSEKAKNPDLSLHHQMSDDIFKILSKTAMDCNLTMTALIHHLKYAIIGFGERMNEFANPLQAYIRNTQSPTLAGFNKTIDSSSALSSVEVDQFNALFDMYYKLVLPAPGEMPSSLSPVSSTVTSDASQLNVEAASTTEERTKLNITPKTSDKSFLQETSSSSAEEKPLPLVDVASSASAGKQTQPESPRPSIESDTDLNFIWVEPNLEDYYEDFRITILPGRDSQCNIKELISQIADEWIGKRIFLCLSAEHVRDLLPRIHEETELYRIYVLCQNKAEEDAFRKEKDKFKKIRIATNSRQAFIRQLALDVVQSFTEVADLIFNEKDYDNAIRWYESARQKVIDYDDSGEKFLLSTIDKKLARCYRA